MNQYEIELRDKVALMSWKAIHRDNSIGKHPSIRAERAVVIAYDYAAIFMAEREKRDKELVVGTYKYTAGQICTATGFVEDKEELKE